MCGIVGVAGDITAKMDKTFKTLLIFDSLRGIDSTGVAAITRHSDEVSIAKQIGNPFELFDHPSYVRALNRQNRVLIGHNRFATQGGVNRANAHPFDFDRVVGVHNGTLHNKHKLDDSADFKVDSQNLFHHINKNGLEHAIKLCEGAWSLVWWDKVTETLNFLRNKERPMFIAQTLDNKSLVWASEDWMIEIACAREDVKIGEIVSTNVDEHFAFHIPRTYADLEAPEHSEVKGHQGSVVVHNHYVDYYKKQEADRVEKEKKEAETASGKVISFQKATTVTDQNTKTGGALYSGTLQVKLDVLSEQKDVNGAKYVVCFDENAPQTNIRLYLKKEDKADKLVGNDIIGDIGKYHMERGGRGYFKVNYSTFRLAEAVAQREANNDEGVYLGRKGHFLSKRDWEQENGECDWCSSAIFAGDIHKFVNQRDNVLCSVCSEDSEALGYLNH